jgi:hypothetical protein
MHDGESMSAEVSSADRPVVAPEPASAEPAGETQPTSTVRPSAESRPVEAAEPIDRPWRRAITAGLWVWLASRLALTLFSAIAWIGEFNRLSVGDIAYKWGTQFDSYYFLTITTEGYRQTSDQAYAAFFPGYPALAALLAPLFGGQEYRAMLFVSNVALLVALVLIYRLTDHELGGAVASRTTFYLVAYPTGFFLTAAYNEGMFIALLLGAVYCVRRGHWWLAGGIGAAAAFTRSAGLLLVLPFLYEYVRQHGRRIRPDVLAVGLIPVGLLGVMAVNQYFFDDPMAFSKAQSQHWGRQFDWFWVPIYDAATALGEDGRWTGPFMEIWIHNALELGTVVLLLVLLTLAVVGPWRMRRDQLVLPLFGFALTLFMISFPTTFKQDIPYPLVSTSRIGLEVFPAFMMLGVLGRHLFVDRLVLVAGLTMQGVLLGRFLHGGWIA